VRKSDLKRLEANVPEVKMTKAAIPAAVERRPTDSEYVGITQAAQIIQVSEATIRRFLTQRKLKRFKIGARTIVKRSEVIGLIREV
jgi:hypothetical protein